MFQPDPDERLASRRAQPRRWLTALFDPVDAAPLIYARIVFGAFMAIEVLRFFENGWITTYFVRPTLFFAYPGFEWVRPLPGEGMYVLFWLAGLAAAGVATGIAYRASAITLAICWSWSFFSDQTNYLNHGWLLCLLAWIFAVLPARPRTDTVPRWAVLLVTGQIALVYFFGAIAKLDSDWLSGDVARFFLSHSEATAAFADSRPARVAFALTGLLFDLLIVPGLLWRRTRLLATLAACAFHVMNAWLFRIGIFPWVMLALTPIYYPPAFSRALLERLRLLPKHAAPGERARYRPLIAGAFLAWFTLQAALPLRHWLYPGQVNWTEEGHNFSWHMKLRVKRGETHFTVVSRYGIVGVDPRDVLTSRQAKKLSTRPEMIRQFARELRRCYAGAGVYVDARASLNGRPLQPLIDPAIDLGSQERALGAASWIVSLRDTPAGADDGDDVESD